MESLKDFQSTARNNGYVEVSESEGGTAVWFRKSTPDLVTGVHKRLCIDGVTKSATVFWEELPSKVSSKTFRTAAALQQWLAAGRADLTASVNSLP